LNFTRVWKIIRKLVVSCINQIYAENIDRVLKLELQINCIIICYYLTTSDIF